MKAFVLAAGLGTRLLPYTLHTPKPLFTLNERPLLDIIVQRLIQAGCCEIMINTHHLHDQIESFVARRQYPLSVQTRFEPEILGTGGAIANIADFWSDHPLLIVNADIVSDIDLAKAYRFHLSHSAPVTMVMHDEPQFNGVLVDGQQNVIGFDPSHAPSAQLRKLAFTGIHVVDRRVLDYLPSRGPAHIINAYKQMIAAGEGPRAWIISDHYWCDIGTPESYKTASLTHMLPAAFGLSEERLPEAAVRKEKLKGDGSDRQWYRVRHEAATIIAADHGIRSRKGGRQEVDAFVSIGNHLTVRGAAVPRIHAYDTFSGQVLLEDLGNRHLQDEACQSDPTSVQRRYEQVIDQWIHMALEGAEGFDTSWTYQSTHYDSDLILEKECRYFLEAFVNGYLNRVEPFHAFEPEFRLLARRALENAIMGFMHRDLQSRNIMIKTDNVYFIDFQGGRLGPLQYDLASLLIDPYVKLPETMQTALLDYATKEIQARTGADRQTFLQGYRYCSLTRNLQMLGAFGYLTRVKGKDYFDAFIPTALTTLKKNMNSERALFPKLAALVDDLTLGVSV